MKTATMASATQYRDLPSDLFLDILSRLPVKSLLRFRCVSKPWLALVDDANFARLHLNNFKNNSDETRLFVVKGSKECVLMCSHTFKLVSEIPISFSSQDWSVVSSLHGLILLKSFKSSLMVWNPSIRKLLQIPPLVAPQVLSSTSFRDKESLGYDQVSNTYKIVKLMYTMHSVAIYDFGADSWKIIDKGSDWHWDVHWFDEAVYFRGSLYFIARDQRIYESLDLVWFDLSKEVFSSVSVPNSKGRTLVLMDGGPSVLGIDTNSSEMYAMVLDIKSKSWTKTGLYFRGHADFFHIKKNGDMLTWSHSNDNLLMLYEVKSYNRGIQEWKILQPCDFYISHVSSYVESLIMYK